MHFKHSTIFRVLLTAMIAAAVFSSCSKIPEESKHIPKDAGIVLGINSKQVVQKLVTNGITMDKLFAALQEKDTASEAAKAIRDAENSGIDLNSNFFASVVFGEANNSYAMFTGSLKDAARFEAFLKKSAPGFTSKTQNDFTYAWLQDDQSLVAWTKSSVIYLHPFDMDELKKRGRGPVPGFPGPDAPDSMDEEDADAATPQPAVAITAEDEGEAATWAAVADKLFHLKDNETAGSIPAFKDLLKESADMSFFVHPEVIYNNQLTMLPANFKKLLEDCYYAGTVDFDKGQIVMNGRSYAGEALADIYKKYGNNTVDLDMLEKYPSGDISAFVAYGFDLRMIGDIIKSTGTDGIVNMMMGKSGLTLDDVLNAFKGQMVFVASDFEMKKKPLPFYPEDSTMSTDSKWVFAMKVGDKAAFEKLMNSPMVKGFFEKQGDQYVPTMQGPNMPAVSINDKLVTAASDSALLKAYLAGNGKAKLDNDLTGKIKGNPLGMYVNFEKIMQQIPESEMPEDGKPLALQAKNLLKELHAVSQPFNGKMQESQVVLTFKNEQENSLVQLVNLGTAAAKYYREQKVKEESVQEDTTVATEAAPEE
ncbi:DUF4836 family protein [Chitinophaga japonensis]|uniref:Uncharacterized protein DUF4836 n=1 Tax=Chitinophaga japonensis TaxID=104662 RepID=A0A562TEU6_CHIJA|nr:DUF4836 family protein [Chitinophaga japonensis]TWI91798.1 uncharacterized protein DUF4836 [Chitinophaga japonensis]